MIDRSGSMGGEKLKQAKEAAIQVIEGLDEGEAFNVIDYSDSISSFAAKPVIKDTKNAEEVRHYIRKLTASGGTNIHDVLTEALRPKPIEGMLPIVLFLTDGLPTVGVRDEAAIREAAAKANAEFRRRIFTFGVGYDVNTPLLTSLARGNRAAATFVLPNEQIEVKVSQVFRRLCGPVMTEPKLEVKVLDAKAGEPLPRVEWLPNQIPDLFEQDQLVLLGRYETNRPIELKLTGSYGSKVRNFGLTFNPERATTRNSFVPRLWASRKIAMLIDQIRQAGAETAAKSVLSSKAAASADPKMKELVDEIVRLSLEFGILTEYTAFLAKEGTNLEQREKVVSAANTVIIQRAQGDRSGVGSVNQDYNGNGMLSQSSGNRRNVFYDSTMNAVQNTRVQQVSDRAFFQQGNRWVDGNIYNSARQSPDQVIKAGSKEHAELLDRLVKENRQGVLSISGEVMLQVDGRNVLITGN